LGPFASTRPWIIAEDEDAIAHEWHEKYIRVKQFDLEESREGGLRVISP